MLFQIQFKKIWPSILKKRTHYFKRNKQYRYSFTKRCHKESDFSYSTNRQISTYQKGQDILIEAIFILHQKGFKNISVDFIGDGESKDFLKELVKSKQLENQIHFLGSKEQSYIFSHLKEYDLFVQPSRKEGFGLTVTEAMVAKIPVLVSDQEGPMEIIKMGNMVIISKVMTQSTVRKKLKNNEYFNKYCSFQCISICNK